jgi:hypothetical protein
MRYNSDMTKQLVWKLPSYLDTHGLTRYQLMQELGDGKGRVAYKWKELPERLDTEALERVMSALEKLTGREVAISDLLDFESRPEPLDEESKAWLESDLSQLGEYEPYDWGDEDPETLGSPVEYVPGKGLLVLEEGK